MKKYAILAALVVSLLGNAVGLISLARSSGMRRLMIKMDMAELHDAPLDFQKEAEAHFRSYPNTPGEVVFLGDSLVASGPWSEFYGNIKNRGIGGSTSAAVLDRVDEVTEAGPSKVFLLVGTNDLAAQVPVAQLLRNYRKLLERIRKDSPGTAITVVALVPVNPTFPKAPTQDNARIAEANARLRELVAEYPGVGFLDLKSYLADRDGNLRREFTADGIHLNHEAYLAIRGPLSGLVADPGTSAGKPSEVPARP